MERLEKILQVARGELMHAQGAIVALLRRLAERGAKLDTDKENTSDGPVVPRQSQARICG